MKTILTFLVAVTLLATAGTGMAQTQVEAGPRHGRILHLQDRSAEFYVEKDRTISIAFYDAAKKQVAPGEETITAIAEAPGGKQQLAFEKKGDLLVSTTPLPAGEHYNVVVQAREGASGKPKNFRIKLDLSICGECQNPEYACTCNH